MNPAPQPMDDRLAEVIARMGRPEALTKDGPLKWSPGRGADVWAMFCAAIAGDLPAMRRLVESDPSLVRCHYNYRKPLCFAVRENRLNVTEFLLERDPDPIGLAVNDSLLDIARDRGYAEMEKLLEAKLAALHGASAKGEPVAAAIRAYDVPAALSLIDRSPDLLNAGDARGNQPIHWAVMTRQIGLIDELLSRGADVNAARTDHARPIHLTNGDYHHRGWRDVPKDVTTTPREVLDHLRARGAYVDISVASFLGDTARVSELLAEHPSLANRPSEYVTYYFGSGTPLRNAAGKGHLEVVRLLLERGADPNQPEEGIAPDGHALYAAVYDGHYDVAKLLLEHGAYPNPVVESSADALSIALSRGDAKMVELLCSYGAARGVDLLAHYNDLQTAAAVFAADPSLADNPDALPSAAGHPGGLFVRLMLKYQPDLAKRVWLTGGQRDVLEFLFERGLDPSRRDWLGITPLHEQARRGHTENATLFLDRGADLHARDEEIRSTPLGWAAKFGQEAMVRLLLSRGARVNLPDDPPWATPLAWATRRGHVAIAELLSQDGATQ